MYIHAVYILAGIGFLLSTYLLFVELKLQQDPSYKPVCELSDKISCITPIKSKYGSFFFGISNSALGALFYITLFFLACINQYQLLQIAIVAANSITPILAYILYVKLRTICLICTAIYVVNALLLLAVFF